MLETQYLFSNPPTSIGDVWGLVFSIFFSNWKSFILLSGMYSITLVAAILIVIESIGYMHEQSYYLSSFSFATAILLALIVASSFMIGMSFSVFTGAFHHFVADTYTSGGGSRSQSQSRSSPSPSPSPSPSVSRSLNYGWQQRWKVFAFFVVFSTLEFIHGVVYKVTIYGIGLNPMIWFPLGSIIALVTTTVMIGVVPSIVVENKMLLDGGAILRSYHLCKNYFCFIFWNLITFHILSFICSTLIGKITTMVNIPTFISSILDLVINWMIIKISFYPILVMILYMSIRIRSEQLTEQELSDELNNIIVAPPVANNAVEMSDTSTRSGDYRAPDV